MELRPWSYALQGAWIAGPSQVRAPQGQLGVSRAVLVAEETCPSGWQQSKENRPARSVAGQLARVPSNGL